MSRDALDLAVRASGGRIIAALAARFRDLDLVEDAFAEACARAAERWPADGAPRDPAAWLWRAAERKALDALRRRRTRERLPPDAPEPELTPEDRMAEASHLIPDERLRLIFVCCHPAVAPEARAALTLRLVCGLSTLEIARAFLVAEPALAQRLVRAKRKIAEAGVPFEIPGPAAWPERMAAVLSTLEVAYAKAHEDAAGAGAHAGYASEMLGLTRTLAELVPAEADAQALAALVRFAEARRPARLDETGAMVPLSEQNPALWTRPLIEEGQAFLARAVSLARFPPKWARFGDEEARQHRKVGAFPGSWEPGKAPGPPSARVLQAAVHGAWCQRRSLEQPAPWRRVLALYDHMLEFRDDAVVRLNRAVALAETDGPAAALAELEALDAAALAEFQPYHAVRADLLRRMGRTEAAQAAYDRALALCAGPAERLWLERRRGSA